MIEIDSIVCMSLYYLYFLGCLLIIYEDISMLHYRIKSFKGLERRIVIAKKSRLNRELENLLAVVTGGRISVGQFKFFSVAIFILVLLMSSYVVNMTAGVIYALLAGICPYALLKSRLRRNQTKGSFEAENLIMELVSRYGSNYLNIEATIEDVIKNGKEIKTTKKCLFQLLIRIQKTKNEDEIQAATEQFAYAIGTKWSKMLACNLFIGITTGSNILSSLEAMLTYLRDARELLESQKRSNIDGIKMSKYATPGLYLFLSIIAVYANGIAVKQLIYNQFATSQGLSLILIIAAIYFFTYLFYAYVGNQKFDY